MNLQPVFALLQPHTTHATPSAQSTSTIDIYQREHQQRTVNPSFFPFKAKTFLIKIVFHRVHDVKSGKLYFVKDDWINDAVNLIARSRKMFTLCAAM